MPGPDGAEALLHSRYDPRTEAARLVAEVEVAEQYCFIVGGLGLGHHVLALREVIADECIIVVTESSLPLVATAMACVDLTPALDRDRLIILVNDDKARLHQRLKPRTALMMLGAKFVSHPASQRLAGAFHSHMRRLLTDFVAYSRMTIMTLVSNAEVTCRNIAYNLPRFVCTPPIDVVHNRFEDFPGVIVSAGPSLRRNIDGLAAAKGRAVICAVQTALKPLMSRGIKPDFVTSLDFHEISRRYFEGVEDLDDVHLIAEPKATWHVVDQYPGPVSLLDNDFARLLIGEELAARDGLPAGATVAHLAFYLACYMGCNPIILVGQDLAFTGHVFYIPGVEIHQTWRSELNRFNTMETKEWERIVRNRRILRKVIGNDGRELYSDDLLFTYLEQFEKDISQTAAKVVNATEGGARISGTEVMTLAEALERYCTRRIPAERFAYRAEARHAAADRLPDVRTELRACFQEVEEMATVCEEMIGLLHKLEGLTHDPVAFNRVIIRVDELRAFVNRAQRPYRIINAGCQLAELRRFSADRKMATAGPEGVELAKRQLKRDLQYVGDLKYGAERMAGILSTALDRVDAALDKASESKLGRAISSS